MTVRLNWGIAYMMALGEQDCTDRQVMKIANAIRSLQCTREEARRLLADRLEQQCLAFLDMAEAFGEAANEDDGFDPSDDPESA